MNCWSTDQQDLKGAQDLVEQNCANFQGRVIACWDEEKQHVFEKRKVSSLYYCLLAILQYGLKNVGMMIKNCHISTKVKTGTPVPACCLLCLFAWRGSPKASELQAAVGDHLAEQDSPAWAESTTSCRNSTFQKSNCCLALEPTSRRWPDPASKGLRKSAFPYIFTCKRENKAKAKPWLQQPTRDLQVTTSGCISAILTCKTCRPTWRYHL